MHTLPPVFFKMSTRVVNFLVCSFFFLLFLAVYNPFHLDTILDMGQDLYTFNVSIMTAIVLAVLAGLGTAFHFLGRVPKITWAHYILWCMGEVMIVAIFLSMYIHLMLRGEYPYFTVLLRSVGHCYGILIYPDVILALSYSIGAYHIREKKMKEKAAYDDSLVRFYDEHQQVKFIIAQSAVLYINAD